MMDFEEEEGTAVGEGVRCEVCGATNFICEGGVFFCSECNTQSQDTRQYVERDEFFAPGARGRGSTFRGAGSDVSSTRKGMEKKKRMLSFEGFNCCLKLMVDKLIELGFPATLREEAFSLWTKYLERRKAIFVSKTRKDVPECLMSAAQGYHGKNCNCWFLKAERRRRRRRKAAQRANANSRKGKKKEKEEVDEKLLSLSVKKWKESWARRKAMEVSYNAQYAEMMGEESEGATGEKKKTEVKKVACKLTAESKAAMRAVKKAKASLGLKRLLLGPEIFTFKTLMALVFVALRQIGCSVLISDVIRFVANGTLYFSSLRLVFGEEASTINGMIDTIFDANLAAGQYLSLEYVTTIHDFLLYVGVQDFKRPELYEILPKFVDDFALPRELEGLIMMKERILPLTFGTFIQRSTCPNFHRYCPEFMALANIIIALRLLFGMDDVTERYQSKFAKLANTTMAKIGIDYSYTTVFDIEDWFVYMRDRSRVFKKEMTSPACYKSVVAASSTVKQVFHFVDTFTGHKGVDMTYPVKEENRQQLAYLFKTIPFAVAPFLRSDVEGGAPTYSNSISLQQEEFAKKYVMDYPRVLNPAIVPTRLNKSFNMRRVDFILNPKLYVDILESEGYKVKVLPGTADLYPDLEELEKDHVLLFQPYKKFDDHHPRHFATPESLKLVLKLGCEMLLCDREDEQFSDKLMSVIDSILYYYSFFLAQGLINVFSYDPFDDDDMFKN